jgi:3-methyladenine DNA glycosylase Tag
MAFDVEQESEKHARADELAILRHAQRLKAIRGRARAIQVLEETMRDVSSPSLLSEFHIGR